MIKRTHKSGLVCASHSTSSVPFISGFNSIQRVRWDTGYNNWKQDIAAVFLIPQNCQRVDVGSMSTVGG